MLERCTDHCGSTEEGAIHSAGKGDMDNVEETVSQKSDI